MNLMPKISCGLFVCSAKLNDKSNACIINTLMQQTAVQPEIVSVTVNKSNLTCDYISKTNQCVVGIISQNATMDIIKHFGFASGRTVDKFSDYPHKIAENGIAVPVNAMVGYLNLVVKSSQDLGTHMLFLCEVVSTFVYNDDEPLTYSYYQQHIKPQPAPISQESYVCKICGYVRKGAMTDDLICPICKHSSEYFEKLS